MSLPFSYSIIGSRFFLHSVPLFIYEHSKLPKVLRKGHSSLVDPRAQQPRSSFHCPKTDHDVDLDFYDAANDPIREGPSGNCIWGDDDRPRRCANVLGVAGERVGRVSGASFGAHGRGRRAGAPDAKEEGREPLRDARALAPRAALALPAVGGPRACASALRALRLFEWGR